MKLLLPFQSFQMYCHQCRLMKIYEHEILKYSKLIDNLCFILEISSLLIRLTVVIDNNFLWKYDDVTLLNVRNIDKNERTVQNCCAFFQELNKRRSIYWTGNKGKDVCKKFSLSNGMLLIWH